MRNFEKVAKMNDNIQTTFEGGVGYEMSFKESLAEFFSLGLLNGNFYQSQEEVLKNARHMFERALAECPEFATKCAIYGNNVNSLKLVPTVWLVYLSTLEDKTMFKKAFPKVIRNLNMLHDFMEISRKGGIRKGLGRGIKKVMADRFICLLNDYQASRMKNTASEIAKVVRPLSDNEDFQMYMKYIAKDELSFPRAQALKEVIENISKNIIDEYTICLIDKYKFQLEELKHAVNNVTIRDMELLNELKDGWDLSGEDIKRLEVLEAKIAKSLSAESKQILYAKMYEGLRYTALILNLVALERVYATESQVVMKCRNNGGKMSEYKQLLVIETDVPTDIIKMIVSKIEKIDEYRKSNMLPFALITAERMVVTPELKTAIGNLLKIVAEEAFKIDKDIAVMLGVDTSYSMTESITDSLTCLDIATLFGAMIKKSHANTKVFAVASSIKEVHLKKQDELFCMARQIEETEVGCGTYFEQLMDKYNGEQYMILLTDSMGADNLEAKWLKADKPKGAKLIVWQLEAYQTKLSNDSSVVYLAGYSDRLLGLVKNIIEGKSGQIEVIEKVEI